MEAGREDLMSILKRLEGRLVPDTSPERMSDNEAMRIHIYRDRRWRSAWRAASTPTASTARAAARSETRGPVGRRPVRAGRAADVYYQAASRNRITLQVLDRVLMSLAATRGRKSLILVSQGFIYDPQLDEFKDVVQTVAPLERRHVLRRHPRPGRHAQLHERRVRAGHRQPGHRRRVRRRARAVGGRRDRWPPTAAASRSRTRTTSPAASSASPTRRRATT